MHSIPLTVPTRRRSVALVCILFPIAVFLLSRQIAANAVGLGKDTLSAIFVISMSVVAIAGFDYRLREVRRDFRVIDTLTLLQSAIAGVAISLYYLGGRIEPSEAVFSAYYYCFAPFLVYAGFLLCRLPGSLKNAAITALGLAYVLTVVAAVCEVLGINFWLFEHDRWSLQPSGLGFFRATGLYGSQIDYGCLSFMVFSAAYYTRRSGGAWRSLTMMALSSVGLLLTISRVWIAAAFVVVIVDVAARSSWKRIAGIALGSIVLLAALYPAAQSFGIVDFLSSRDELTRSSNQDRLYYYRAAPKWLLEDYVLVGTGPGTQNGPDVHGKKIVADALWLGILVDFGTAAGSILVLLKVGFAVYVLARARKDTSRTVLKMLTIALGLALLLPSLVDSAFEHPVSISVFYLVAGLYLYLSSKPEPTLARQPSQPQAFELQ